MKKLLEVGLEVEWCLDHRWIAAPLSRWSTTESDLSGPLAVEPGMKKIDAFRRKSFWGSRQNPFPQRNRGLDVDGNAYFYLLTVTVKPFRAPVSVCNPALFAMPEGFAPSKL